MINPVIRLPAAAHAIGATPKAVEHWLAAGFRLLCEQGPERAWRAIAAIDLIRLAVVRRLQIYGLSVPEAEGVLARTLDGHLMVYPLAAIPCPWCMVLSRLAGRTLTVSRDVDGRICASHAALGPAVGDAHGSDHVTLDIYLIAEATRARLQAVVKESVA